MKNKNGDKISIGGKKKDFAPHQLIEEKEKRKENIQSNIFYNYMNKNRD